MRYDFVFYFVMLLGFFNGLIASLVISFVARSSKFLRLAALAVFLFSLTILREFIYVFGDELNMNLYIEKFFFFKLLSVGVIVLAYTKAFVPESKNDAYLLIPGFMEFLSLSLISIGWVKLPSLISDILFISVDCVAFFWILLEFAKLREKQAKPVQNIWLLRLFVVGFLLIFLTRTIQLVAVILDSSLMYEFHFLFRVIAIGVVVYMLSIYLIFSFSKHPSRRGKTRPSAKPTSKALLEKIEKDQKYLSMNITLEKLASHYSVDSKTLSSTIREHEKSTFNDYLNSLRLQHFMSLVAQMEHKRFTIIALAEQSGFNSKATFYRVFKKKYGISPSSFIKR